MEPGAVTTLLDQLRQGDKQAESALFSLVYKELHRMASRSMEGEREGHLLQTTALVHEAYLRLVRRGDAQFNTRSHFFAVAATVMRQILVDHARARLAGKRGGGQFITSLDECAALDPAPSTDMLALDQALRRLADLDSRQAKVVEMRFFAGMTEEEIAGVLGVSSRTVKRDWTLARAWLYGELKP